MKAKKDDTEVPKWFGAFLRSEREKQGMSLKGLVERAEKEKVKLPKGIGKPNEAMLSRLERGDSKQKVFDIHNREHLKFLEEVYQADVPLLYAAFPRPISPIAPLSSNDFTPISDTKAIKATYCIATKRLEDAAQAIILLSVEPEGESRLHSHPGNEIMFVIEGNITARIIREDIKYDFPVKKHEFIHFVSNHEHKVLNNGSTKAEVLIIRSYPTFDKKVEG